MVAVATGELVCLYLSTLPSGDAEADGSPVPYGCSVPGISDGIGSNATDSDLDLLSVLSDLVDEGFVEASVRSVEGLEGDRTVYQLTPDGRQHALELRSELSEEWITLRRDGGDRQVRLGDIGEHVDVGEHFAVDDPVVGAVAALDDEDRLVLETTRAGERFANRTAELGLLRATLLGEETNIDRIADDSTDADAEGEDVEPVSTIPDVDPSKNGIVIRGPTGIGKTSLVTEFARVVRDHEGHVLTGSAGPGAGEPYGPVRSALMGGGAFDAAALFSEFDAGEADTESYEAQRRSLFVEVTEAIETFVGNDPALLFLDELQWADPATLEFVEFLLEQVEAPTLLVVAAYNTELTEPEDKLVETVDRAQAEGTLQCIDLEPLSPAHLESMIKWYLDAETIPDAFATAVYRRTGGNPLFVAESVRHLEDEGVITEGLADVPTDPETIPLPETVEKVLATRLSRLAEEQLSLLQTAAVIGEQVPLSVLARVTDRTEAALQDVATAFVDADLWELDPAAEVPLSRAFRFGSAAIRDTVLDTMAEDRQKGSHERVAEALLAVRGQDEHGRHARVAYHYEQAECITEAIEQYRAAAEHAVDVYAHDSALESLDSAFELADGAEEETAIELALELARVRTVVGEYDRATNHAEYVRDHTDDDEQVQLALFRLSQIAEAGGELERAVELATEGLTRTPDRESAVVCQLLHAKCKAEWRQGRYDTAFETARRQHELAASLDDPDLIADALHDLGTIRLQQGAYDQAEERFQTELEIRRERGDRHGVAGLLNNLGIVAYRQLELEKAREYHEEALQSYREIGSRHDVAACLVNLGLVLKAMEEYEQGRSVLEESLETFRDLGNRPGVSATLTNLGLLASNQGDLEAARQYHEEGLAIAHECENRHNEAENLDGLGVVAHERGDHEQAREFFEESLSIKRELGTRTNVADTLRSLGELALDNHDLELARDHLQEAEEHAEEVGNAPLAATCQILLALVAIHDEDPATAEDWCDQALGTLSSAGEADDESLEAIEWLDELTADALEAGHDRLAHQWCAQALVTIDSLDIDTDEIRDQFERRLAKAADE
jgi:tetratricopeptide (TPR) repeat protein